MSTEIHAAWTATGGLSGQETTDVDMTDWTPEQIADWASENVDAKPDDINPDELIWFSVNGEAFEKVNGEWQVSK